MLRSKTVFVLGAGASKEAGLPIGVELKSIIANKLDLRFDFGMTPLGNGDMSIFHALQREYRQQINNYLEAGWQIRDGIVLSDSIDDYIDAHQHDARIAVCGKLAIARSILEAEQNSKLCFERTHRDSSINFSAIDNTWYMKFYRLLTKQVLKSEIENVFNNVTVVSFNYDRCLEHFLVHALVAGYRISLADAQGIVEKLTIFHPYGVVGPYFGTAGHNTLEFGFKGIRSASEILANIKTYTEQIEEGEELKKIQNAISEADIIAFLGMAYHRTNMAMLVPTKPIKRRGKLFYGTRKGLSDSDLLVVCRDIDKLQGNDSDIYQVPRYMHFVQECKNLFEEYQRSLAQ